MKTILVIMIAALFSGNAFSQGTVRPGAVTGVVVGDSDALEQKTRKLWANAQAYLSEDKTTFTEGARQTLTDLATEIDTVAGKVSVAAPAYFLTRLQALRLQHEYLRQKLQRLTPEAIKSRLSGPRYAFDKCIGSLEKAIEQADDEADLLMRIPPEEFEARR